MNIDERKLKDLIDLYGVDGVVAACYNYKVGGSIKLNKIDEISDEMIDEVIDALYNLSDDFDYKVVKDRRSKGEQFVKIRIQWGYDINFRITPQGEYSLIYFSGLGKALSKSTNFDECLENFILKFTPILRKI